MNPSLLHALARFVTDTFAGYEVTLVEENGSRTVTTGELLMESPKGGVVVPRVFIGAVPDDIGDEEAFPCVVVRTGDSEFGSEDDVHELQILVGVHGPRGGMDVDELTCMAVRRIVSRLRSMRILELRWELVLPVRATRPDPKANEKRHAYDVAIVTTRWREPAPQEPLEV